MILTISIFSFLWNPSINETIIDINRHKMTFKRVPLYVLGIRKDKPQHNRYEIPPTKSTYLNEPLNISEKLMDETFIA